MTDRIARRVTLAAGTPHSGLRVDKFLSLVLPELSRSRLKALVLEGRLSRGAQTITDPDYRVKPGQVFKLVLPPASDAEPAAQALPLDIVYEDAHLIVVDKPAGLVVHPAPGNPDRTLVNALLAHCGASLLGIGGVRRPGIVHRLDKETSGLLVAVKSDAAHAALAAQFARHALARAYRAVVWGSLVPAHGVIEGNIGRSAAQRKKMALLARGGKRARTRYRTLQVFAGGAASLIECRLETGRTHQIRVHLSARGHPVIGDALYGGRRVPRRFALSAELKAYLAAFPRQALHACELGFRHPITGEELAFASPLPSDMAELIARLEREEGAVHGP